MANAISYEQALQYMKPAYKMHDVITGTIDTAGGSDTKTFKPNRYDLLIYRSVFSAYYSDASTTKTKAIIPTSVDRDKFTAKIELTGEKVMYNPVDIFDWNSMNTDNVNNYFWQMLILDTLEVTFIQNLTATLYAIPVPINWSFSIQYYEIRDKV